MIEDLVRQASRAYDCATHSAGNTQALLEVIDGEPILAFRGTENDFEDILTDVRFFPWYSPALSAWCHKGFLRSTQEIYPILIGDASAFIKKGRLHITGHSLGAAQGTLFACMLRAEGLATPDQITLTGFGSPPPQYGNGLNKWLAGVEMVLFKNGSDCVTRHPLLGSHVAPLTEIGPEGYEPFIDHRISEYIKAIV